MQTMSKRVGVVAKLIKSDRRSYPKVSSVLQRTSSENGTPEINRVAKIPMESSGHGRIPVGR